MTIEQLKLEFIKIYQENIKRKGSEELLKWILASDFFKAPASARFHSNFAGGLCEHSIKVYKRLVELYEQENLKNPKIVANINYENLAIAGLLHDLCKVNFYKEDFKNVKNEFGVWEKVPCYSYNEDMPIGHGEKSVMIIMQFMLLTKDEIAAINWHMGGFDKRVLGGDSSISHAFEKFPLAVLTHSADFLCTYLDEETNK